MKTTKFILFSLIIAQMLTLVSCDDWLELVPENSVPKSEYWKTKEDVQAAMTGIYCGMLSSGVSKNMILWGEVRADMMTEGRYVDANYNLIRRGEISSANSFSNYSSFYSVINNCNLLLKYSDLAYDNDNSFTEKELHQLKAQAIAARSLMYFYLVRTFSDVPFPLEGYSENSQKLTIEKTKQSVILDSLSNQLESLRDNNWIPVNYSNTDAAKNKGYITRYAVDALLADIYLWNNKYEECIEVCNEIINSGQFTLIPVEKSTVITIDNDTIEYATSAGAEDLFRKLYVDGNSVESIFELQFDRDITNPFFGYFVNTSRRSMMPNDEHIKSEIFMPTEKDGVGSVFVDIRQSISSKNGYLWKWAGVTYSGTDVYTEEEMRNNLIVYRLAQIYLMKAEALTQLGMISGNQNLLNEAYELVKEIRDRAGAVETTDIKKLPNGTIDAGSLEALIIEEQGRELMFEGKRWFDILRNAKRNDYKNIGYLMQIVPYSVVSDKVYSVKIKYQNKWSHYLPLPEYDIQNNKLLVQNPFYDTSKK